MSEQLTEKLIRSRLSTGQTRFGDNTIKFLLSIIDEQRGTIAMHEANADESALRAARREAEIESNTVLFQDLFSAMLLHDDGVGTFNEPNNAARLQIEIRNLRAQVAEARAAGHPVNLFEELANKAKLNHGINTGVYGPKIIGNVQWNEVE